MMKWIQTQQSYSCSALIGKNARETEAHKNATVRVLYFLGGGKGGDSLIHVTLHLRLAASSTCSETTNPSASQGPGRLCPSMWIDTMCGVDIIRLTALAVFVLS
ncbi:hypothetical protein PBY51_009413 [Eleginops maclovinus]|uniref:Uncharacterized protein n=1 Tax=Eleginops maclovinus TaxID=56733 RepID=A0AAN7XYH7_ELEMC|nr:hypothetical protein PBY51_009413 [Eleginops maclovinus]